MSKMMHDLHLVVSHCPERVILMTRATLRLTRITIPAEISQDYAEPFRKSIGDFVPHGMCLRITMEKEQRRAGTSPECSYGRSRCRNVLAQKAWK